ncbi:MULTISPECIES: division/cell wall cluster transcriptional repressor MraZ [Turicibacter]|jgi:protein mraZ|uniref:Transcriptional regulator MraZ n=2 Tax=Turicibacter sanguinis TaxID=154288 RepID=A0A173R6G0_9FIRM|nr:MULTISPECIES: division/cell wall cluster transcriptional repressor MraZ [Turicibacter]EFF63399.1 protein MraZ [Turicibacter sanguinis PC909]EGC91430.1 protein MraZ [Turicibacter sp. HGF1]MBP3903591.1 division/cell wall cluster transcriptional repressor MraZ [Turicibacter sp.]MCU7191226.1 division/cell wall cluster transcriptional repressor MraZ [Turicibacter sanguinis]MCU7196103.1 division/cell wall cluster transcriptional repressor MraZ [Turicibacter sanguinis]
MFIGEFHHSIDAKGRLIMPAKFREQLNECCVITRGIDQCLFIYPIEEWKILLEKVNGLPVNRKDARQFSRFFLSGACECEFDKQGRINLSTPLMNYAGLSKDCVIIGVSNRIEIWEKEKWTQYFDFSVDSILDIAENIGFDL